MHLYGLVLWQDKCDSKAEGTETMKRLDAAVAVLEVLDRRRAETRDAGLGRDTERNLIDLFIRDLDPDRDQPARAGTTLQTRLVDLGFIVFLDSPYALLVWLLWAHR
jgi:hypothetical protein